ncbi:MAG: efflux RND transporter periplasmic adaptor subunit [Pirellulales bacterium]|nr:efflux RND transporter periplasmic adaptor subunit [Pirellulales bacterium]
MVVAFFTVVVIAGMQPKRQQQKLLATETAELAVPSVTVVSPVPGKAGVGLLLPAEIKPWTESPIYARANGYLKRWLVDLGHKVKVGQLLAEIEIPEISEELDRARHELALAKAALVLAKSKADRSARMVDEGAVSREEYDEDQAGLAMKTAAVAAAEANVGRVEELHRFGQVVAPFSGVITLRNVDVGDLISASSAKKELFRLAQTNKLRVYVRVPQTNALSIKPGLTAELLIPERPKRIFTAQVARTAQRISDYSRTLLTELEVDNSQGDIIAGSFGQVRFADVKGNATLTLPSNTLLFRAEGPQVGVVRPDDKVELRSIKIGRDFGKTVEILEGITPNDRVIINPSDSLADGAAVRVEQAQSEKSASNIRDKQSPKSRAQDAEDKPGPTDENKAEKKLQRLVFQGKFPVCSKTYDKTQSRFRTLEELCRYFQEKIEKHPFACYIGTFDQYAHTKQLSGGVVDPGIIGARNIIFCFGKKLECPEVLAVRPRSIGICETKSQFIITFLETPPLTAIETMEGWVCEIAKPVPSAKVNARQ